jgi:hypothetical protein
MPDLTDKRPNLLLTGVRDLTPVFVGEQRARARTLLASKIVERQVSSVMQMLNKDPSLALDTLPVRLTSGGVSRVVEMDFPVACLTHDLGACVILAVNAGYDIDKADQRGWTLVDHAVARMSTSSIETELALLLSMGANPHKPTSNATQETSDYPGLFASAMMQAYPVKDKDAKREVRHPNVIAMLLDAGANPVYSSRFKCPINLIINSSGWGEKDVAADHMRMMGRLLKAGASLDKLSGSPQLNPLRAALASKNGDGLVALVRLGVDVSNAAMNGSDLFDVMDARGLGEWKPQMQAALMERTIAQVTAASGPVAPAESDAKVPLRRRMGV